MHTFWHCIQKHSCTRTHTLIGVWKTVVMEWYLSVSVIPPPSSLFNSFGFSKWLCKKLWSHYTGEQSKLHLKQTSFTDYETVPIVLLSSRLMCSKVHFVHKIVTHTHTHTHTHNLSISFVLILTITKWSTQYILPSITYLPIGSIF